ncbi:flavodoxin [Serratia fonticola]|uniref:Flavodoxin n=1 Tax=Serratia fonticola TaxID=47917 RepID=A0A542BUH1_SERFO|nr:cyclophilin-like fold protein [Serratia fonticola]TQI82238.1 flavodoxin [Serratia fonticola]TQI95742.1 flavodoxin [Serratia fonticola]TVZ70237.1 flavodoxin [Serratia fonticola]
MKRLLFIILSIFLALLSSRSVSAAIKEPTNQGNSLIVYYSLSGNTKTIAGYIHKWVGGEIAEIKTLHAYPDEFEAVVLQARRERQENYLPPIQPLRVDLKNYDVIYLGFPIWGTTLPQPMATFLSQHDLAGKTLIPFSTHDGFGLGRSRQAINAYAPAATLLESFEMVGADVRIGEPRVQQWLSKLSLLPSAHAAEALHHTPITVTIGEVKLNGFLNNSVESQQFTKMMPQAIAMVGFGGREYYGGIDQTISAQREGQLHFDDGDITYCPQNNTIAIFYAQTDRPNLTMKVIPLGKVTSDLSPFQHFGRSATVTFEPAKQAD